MYYKDPKVKQSQGETGQWRLVTMLQTASLCHARLPCAGSIPLDQVSEAKELDAKSGRFNVVVISSRVYALRADTQELARKWVTAISGAAVRCRCIFATVELTLSRFGNMRSLRSGLCFPTPNRSLRSTCKAS